MFVDSDAHDNIIAHSKELHDMLLEGYKHAIIIKCPKTKTIIKEESGEGASDGGATISKKTMQLTPADVVYEFGKEGAFARVEGFVDQETARMAHEERLELIAKEKYKIQEEERIKLLDLQKHLNPELKNE